MKKLKDVKNDQFVMVTGASNGIGLELAKLFAHNGYNLILVARSEDKLNAIADDFRANNNCNAIVLPCDLSDMAAIDNLHRTINEQRLKVCVLVNNAGFGFWGEFEANEPDRQINMLELNVVGLTHLTRLLVPDMIANGFGKILNVSSIAAFQPVPFAAAYAASKSYVLSFSQAIDAELKEKNIRVTAFCPPDVPPNFQTVAGKPDFVPSGIFASTATKVAEIAYKEFMAGKKVIRPWKTPAKVLFFFDRFLPNQVGIELSKFILKQRIS